MSEALYITMLLVELYIAIGVMLIGFGYMVAGKVGGGRVASFYFGRSLRWAGQRLRSVLAWTITRVRTFVLFWIARPLSYRLWLGMRWLVATRQRMTMTLAVLLLCALTLVAFAATAPAGAQTVTVQAQGHNMFYVDVILNNRVKVRALIDTGATYLSMCGSTAATLGLVLGEDIRLHTANGIVVNRRTMVQSVRVGGIEVRNVAGTVDERPWCDKGVLVGMTVLSKLHVTVDDDRLVLAARSGAAAPPPRSMEWWLLGGMWSVLLLSLLVVRRAHAGLLARRSLRHDQVTAAPVMGRSFFE